jgi:outer membrane lipoprotein carrier protein
MRYVSAVLLFSTLVVADIAAQQPSAAEVATSLQKKYGAMRDFSADFVQNYESGVLKKKISERGTVQVKKPGMMRWDYTTPTKKQFISNGKKMYWWVPSNKEVTVMDAPQDQATTAVLFLAGKGNVTRDFTASLLPDAPAGTWHLKLLPKLQERDYDWLELTVDRQTFQIKTLTAADRQGGQSTFVFSNFKENVGLADKIFEFKIPRGADVINAGQPK